MKRVMYTLAVLLVVFAICLINPLEARADTAGIYTYTVSNGEATITDCGRFAAGSLIIPDTLGGYPVTGIGDSAFEDCISLTSITIPDSVTSIGERAFGRCSDLTSITIPDSVTSIGSSAFYGCKSLTSISIPDGITRINSATFEDCNSLTNITIPNGVTSIGDGAFKNCTSFTSIAIPDGLTSIGAGVFRGCNSLLEVALPDGVKSIGDGAFRGCSSLASITIPNGVTYIGASAFESCTSLTSISIPDSVTGIGNIAFGGCTGLKSVNIPSGLTSIGQSVFSNCINLTSVAIPNRVTSIGKNAFNNCDSLTSITIPGSVKTIGMKAFLSCDRLAEVILSDGVTSIDSEAFRECGNLTSIVIPESVTSIEQIAFYDCNRLKNVTYSGTDEQWDAIYINWGNEALTDAYVYKSGERPTTPGSPTEPSCSNGHQSDAGTVTKEATCTETGTKVYKCLQCTETIKTETLPALEHNYDTGRITKQPTCVEYGEALYTCQRCNETKTVSMSKSKTHNYQAVVTKATLSKDGAVEEKCTGCGKVKSSSVVIRPTAFALHTTSYVYDGQVKKPVVTVQDANGKYLVKGMDYEVTYPKGCTNPGSYQVIVTMTGNYSGSKTLTFNIKLGTPAVTVANTTTGVKVSWGAISGAKTYIVYRSVYSNGTWSSWKSIKTGVTGTSYTDTSLKSNANVKYTVRAVNGDHMSSYKGSSSIKFLATPKVTVSNATNGVKISWGAITGAKTYTVYKSTYSGGKWSSWKSIKTGVTGTIYTDTSVKSNDNVKYTVRAVNSSYMSSYTGSSSIKFLATPTVKATNAAKGVTVTWNKISGAKSYIVYKSVCSGGTWSGWTRVATGVTGTSYTDTTVKSGAIVRYTVKAINGNFTSYFKTSNTTQFLAQPKVTVAKASDGIKATWGKVTGASGYIVYRRTYSNGKWGSWEKIKTTTALNYTDKTAKKGVTYQYTVRAYSGEYKSAYTNSSSIKR